MSDGTATTPPPSTAGDAAPVLGSPAVTNGATGAQTPATTPAVTAQPPAATEPPAAPPPAGQTAPVLGQTKADEQAKAEQKAADDKAATLKAAEDKAAADKKALDDKAAGEKKVAEEKAAADKAWGEWKPQRLDGVTPDDAQLKQFVPIARELGLKPEQAQKIIDFHDKGVLAQREAALTSARQARTESIASLKADKELGGERWDNTQRIANKALEKYAPPELKQYLIATMQDAHPLLVRTFHAIGKAMADDSVAGTVLGAGAPSADPNQAFRGLYPSMFPKKS